MMPKHHSPEASERHGITALGNRLRIVTSLCSGAATF
jgi:hypothetical protein